MVILSFIKKEKVFSVIFILTLISFLRSCFLPLVADENTYLKIADNILKGKYYYKDYPSTITPIVPFIFAFFKINAYPLLGFTLNKLFNIFLTTLGLRYLYLFLERQNIDRKIILSIIALTITTPIAVSSLPSLYPESILFCCFWGVLYYADLDKNIENFKKMFLLFILLVFTRYVYIFAGLILLLYYYNYYINERKSFKHVLLLSLILTTPLIFWAKYVYLIELHNLSEISYFDRFKTENPFIYNLKCGLGLIKNPAVNKINGIPAFASLFVPITGFRNYIISIFLIFTFLFGYFKNCKRSGIQYLLISILTVMLGFMFAGTGFSRYWVVLLPGFYLGYYFAFEKLNLKFINFIKLTQIISFIYIINELRLDLLILNKYVF